MTSTEAGALIVLAFCCWTLSRVAVIAYSRRRDRQAGRDSARKFCVAPGSTDEDEPVVGKLIPTPPKIETSFDGSERIGRI